MSPVFYYRAINPNSEEARAFLWALEAYKKPNKLDWLMSRMGMLPITWPTEEPPEYRRWDCELLSEQLTHTAP